MCGICGVAGYILKEVDIQAFKDLLTISVFRGRDATGTLFATVDKGRNRYFTDKEVTPSPIYTLQKEKMINGMWRNHDLRAAIGHARWATVGDKGKKENAHPFSTPNLVGVHNGSIYNRKKIRDTGKDYETDSEALLNAIDKFGLYETIDEIQEDGAYALTYIDKRTGVLNFYRNDQRPLLFIFNEANDVLYWASEEAMLKFVLERSDIKLDQPWSLKPHVHYKIPLKSRKPFREASHEEYTYKKRISSYHRVWKNGEWVDADRPFEVTSSTSNDTERGFDDTFDQRYVWDKKVRGWVLRKEQNLPLALENKSEERTFFMINNKGLTRQEYEQKLANACTWCLQVASVKDSVLWHKNGNEYLCDGCRDDVEIVGAFQVM